MNGNWSRLKRELPKIGLHDLAAVVIEASMDDVSKGRYRSEMKPHAALQSIFAIRSDIECPSFGPGNGQAPSSLRSVCLRNIWQRFKTDSI